MVSGRPGHLLPLHPLGVGDVLDGTVGILRRAFVLLAAVVVLVHGPYQLLVALVLDRYVPELSDPTSFEQVFTGEIAVELLTRVLLVGGASAIVALLVHVLVGGAVVAVVDELDHGRPAAAVAALRRSFAASGATLGATVLVGVAGAVAGFTLLVVLVLIGVAVAPLAVLLGIAAVPVLFGILLAAAYLVLPVALREDTGPLQTVSRTVWVLRRRFWWTLGVTGLVLLLVGVVSFGVSLLLGLLAAVAGPAAFVVEAVAGTLSALVSVPLTVGAALLIHHDARIRAEGYDLRARAGQPPWA
ncbi:hypothetical protein [Egicoccus halophilus]|uniref:Glycerophosphoryl diester phosphodiesterase membrane domain-containing protein n=1 Tax=Egicoccus halophilus TaxID=1670830 RepID=A0A8J3AD31_9ACTN|nr:hypothetical protein [Egicoccus halophilus]GGI04913.1 hypothetical protein GCM10011354_11470 [Egicoccus halophilus]